MHNFKFAAHPCSFTFLAVQLITTPSMANMEKDLEAFIAKADQAHNMIQLLQVGHNSLPNYGHLAF